MENIIKRNNINVIGTGEKTIVFGHGFGCDQNIWRYITPYFEKDYRIVLFDYVGSGQSDISQYSAKRYADLMGYSLDLEEILEYMQIKDAIYVGHSVSSMIGLLTTIRKPECFQKIVLISPSPRYINEEPDYYGGFDQKDINEILTFMEMNFLGWASANAAALMDNPDKPVLAEQLKDTFTAEDPEIMKNFARATFLSDYRKELEFVTIPTLIIQCSVDSIVPIEVAEYLNRNIKNSALKILDSRGHYPHLCIPEKTAESILEYINV
jgi:sigma-B regulation protein RsbQ